MRAFDWCPSQWDIAGDRDVWRAQRPIADQAVQCVSEYRNSTLGADRKAK